MECETALHTLQLNSTLYVILQIKAASEHLCHFDVTWCIAFYFLDAGLCKMDGLHSIITLLFVTTAIKLHHTFRVGLSLVIEINNHDNNT
jgi:hypothetical protein